MADTQKKRHKNQKKKVRKAKKAELAKTFVESDTQGIREMLQKYAVTNTVVMLSDDDTQMQKTLNQVMHLIGQSEFLQLALQNIKPALSNQSNRTQDLETTISQYQLREEALINQTVKYQDEANDMRLKVDALTARVKQLEAEAKRKEAQHERQMRDTKDYYE